MQKPKRENKIRVNVCMTPTQKRELVKLGGSKFVQWAIENADYIERACAHYDKAMKGRV